MSEILLTLALWGVKEVLYLGGEPTLYPWLCEVLELGHSLGLVQRLVSNGSGFSAPLINAVATTGTEVGITFNSLAAKTHDTLAGSTGSHARAVNTVDRLLSASVATYVQFTLTREGDGSLRELAFWLADRFNRQISMIDMTRLVPKGRGSDGKLTYFPREEEIWRALVSIPEIKGAGFAVRTEALPHCWVMEQVRVRGIPACIGVEICRSIRPCLMGIDQIAFTSDGRVKICPCVEPFGPSIIGHSVPISTAINADNAADLWQQHPVLIERRRMDFLPLVCLDPSTGRLCPQFYSCVGGCRTGGASDCCAQDVFISPLGLDRNSALAFDGAPP